MQGIAYWQISGGDVFLLIELVSTNAHEHHFQIARGDRTGASTRGECRLPKKCGMPFRHNLSCTTTPRVNSTLVVKLSRFFLPNLQGGDHAASNMTQDQPAEAFMEATA
jgi:hypothetical protein